MALNPGDRVGLLGANGAGKSTLVKTLVQQIKPLGGTLHAGQNTAIGYFAQEQLDILHAENTPLGTLISAAPEAREQDLRNFLGGWGFSNERVDQRIDSLSGGERARLALALIAWQKPNLLILDEPTNHLDLDARAALAEALVEFPGALLLVSHDRHLIETTCDELWSIRRGELTLFNQPLSEWLPEPVIKADSTENANSQKAQRKARAASRAQLAPLTRALKKPSRPWNKPKTPWIRWIPGWPIPTISAKPTPLNRRKMPRPEPNGSSNSKSEKWSGWKLPKHSRRRRAKAFASPPKSD